MKKNLGLTVSGIVLFSLFMGLSACVSNGAEHKTSNITAENIDNSEYSTEDDRARMLARYEAELAEIEAKNGGVGEAGDDISQTIVQEPTDMPDETVANFDNVLSELNALTSQDETALEEVPPYQLSRAELDILDEMAAEDEALDNITETETLQELPVEEIAPLEVTPAFSETMPPPIITTEVESLQEDQEPQTQPAHQTQLPYNLDIDIDEETEPLETRELSPIDFLEPSHLEEESNIMPAGSVLPRHNFALATEDSAPQIIEDSSNNNRPLAGFEGDVNLDNAIYQSPFTDIPETHELAEAASYLYDIGVIGGYADGTYRPTEPISRASAVKFILLLSGESIPTRQNNGLYRDLPDGQWFTPYMLAAIEAGYIRAPTNRLLRPGEVITLREFMEIFAHAINPAGSQNAQATYDDQELAEIANRYGMFSHENSITTDILPTKLNRGEVLEALYSFMSVPQVHYIGVRHGRYGSTTAEPGTGRCYRPFGTVQVTIRASAKPVTLALASHEPTIWQINAEEGARIERIFLSGYHIQRITGISDNIPVNRNFYYEIVPPEQGDRNWFYNRTSPEDGYFTGDCSDDEYREDGAVRIPTDEQRQAFSVRSGGEYYATYRDKDACDDDQFCRQQYDSDIETFNRLTGMDISSFQGSYTGTHFVVDPQ